MVQVISYLGFCPATCNLQQTIFLKKVNKFKRATVFHNVCFSSYFCLIICNILNLSAMADDNKIIFSMYRVGKSFPPHRQVLKDISLSFFLGAKIGIIGLNGSGKSTLLKIIAGMEKEYQGEVTFLPGYTVGHLSQDPLLDESRTVREIVEEGLKETMDIIKEFEKINNSFGEPEVYENPEKMQQLMDRQAVLQEKIDYVDGWNVEHKLERAMDALRCPDSNARVNVLSGGERRRVALCRLLLQQPDILLLDEPTNHLDAESVQWLETTLKQYNGTVICITHDRYFLDNVAGWILELDRGEGIPWKGNYSSWLEQKAKRLESEEKGNVKRRKILERELEWVRMSPKARHAKSKARLGAYENLLNQDVKQKEDKLEIFIPNGPRLGDKVIEATAVSKSFDEKLLFEDLEFSLPPNGIVGVIGPNGAGKTTLFRMIMGQEHATKGTFKIGETVTLGYVDQAHAAIDPAKTVYEVISGGQNDVMVGNRLVNARAYVARFNFTGADQEKKCGVLSGGERNRLHLALTLKSGANVLLLDEPTNDIDVNTLRALEEGLENFAGCAVIISHDRWFLDRITTHMLAFEGNSKVVWFEGNYSDYEENYKKRVADTTPARIKYKKLV
jgi:ATP-binding cassette ChvD family protein